MFIFDGFCGFLICVLITFPQGSLSQLTLTAAGPTQSVALVGDTVTLAVSYTSAVNPAIVWRKGPDPIATWTINSSTPADIDPSMAHVLKVSANGSLVLENVPLDYTGSYSVEMTKSGQGTASLNFTLNVYERIVNVTLGSQPDVAVEGAGPFALRAAVARGVVEGHAWLFNGVEVKSGPRYTVDQRSLVIHDPNRSDTGLYSLTLRNPYGSATVSRNVTVSYGPDDPVLTVTPVQQFYVSGDSLSLSCKADGFPPPAATWTFGGVTLESSGGVLHLTNVKTSQEGVYTCTVVNEQTHARRLKNLTIKVYEKPVDNPVCSVRALTVDSLQYKCAWPGGNPAASLSFPKLSNSSRAPGQLSLNVSAAESLDGAAVSCRADHPIQPGTCSVTAMAPAPFIPSLKFGIQSDGRLRVVIGCLSTAVPEPVVSWLRGTEAVTASSGGGRATYTISHSRLTIQDYNVSTFLLHNYTCSCRNPLGLQQRQVHLLAPTISDSSLFPNLDGTVVTLTWEVPPTSIVTGFDIQMQGPDLVRSSLNSSHGQSRSNSYRTIQQKLGSERSADIFTLNPDETYRFRVIPKARLTEGEPSTVHKIGPGEGLSGSAIAGIAAGIPGGIILLLIPLTLLCLLVYGKNDDNEQAQYPVTSEKGMKTKAELAANNMRMTGGLHFIPDYNHLRQVPSERSMDLPTFVPPPPVRVATTV